MAENQEMKDMGKREDPEIAELKKTVNKLRGVAVLALLFSLAGILLCCFTGAFTDVPFGIKGLLWFLFFLSVLGWYATYAVKLVKEFETAVVVRFDRFRNILEPGLRLILWPFDKIDFVDMREQEIDIAEQEVITKDNVVVRIDGLLNVRVFDSYRSLFNVKNAFQMLSSLGQANLRGQIGEKELDEALTKRLELAEDVKKSLNIDAGIIYDEKDTEKMPEVIRSRKDKHFKDEHEKGWGVIVTRARIKKIDPPDDIQEAMHRQAKAEREKRAVKKEAEAIRYKERVTAKGRAEAYKSLLESLEKDKDLKTLVELESLIALKAGMDGKATKIFLPGDPIFAAIAKAAEAAKNNIS